MSYLVYTSEALATQDADQLFINKVEAVAGEHNGYILDENLNEVPISELTDEQKCCLQIYGYREGQRNYNSGFTTAIVKPTKAYNQDKWYFQKPANISLTGVDNYSEEISSIPEDWHNMNDL